MPFCVGGESKREQILRSKSGFAFEPKADGSLLTRGEVYVKELGNGKPISHNNTYKPIILSDTDSIYCCGKVLGTVN